MRMRGIVVGLGLLGVVAATAVVSMAPQDASPRRRVWLHAHNCYPDRGVGADRLWRAIGAVRGPLAIEQDLVWDASRRQPVVAHEVTLRGDEPTLEAHFFRAVAPLLDRALAEGRTSTWPVMVLHLDFKTNEPEHHRAVWALLEAHARWLATAPRTADAARVEPLTPGPLLVLTEAGSGQREAFYDAVPVGGRLLLFGTVTPAPLPEFEALEPDARLETAATIAPEQLIPEGADNYRRWTNHPWAVVERGGQPRAGAWTAADRRRLDAIVGRAHALGLWVRFYTLNGHTSNDAGWSETYNFGTLDRVRQRWRAAIDAGVDFIATDQYEELGAELQKR